MPMTCNILVPSHRKARIKRCQNFASGESDKACLPLGGSSEGEKKSRNFQERLSSVTDKSQRKQD